MDRMEFGFGLAITGFIIMFIMCGIIIYSAITGDKNTLYFHIVFLLVGIGMLFIFVGSELTKPYSYG